MSAVHWIAGTSEALYKRRFKPYKYNASVPILAMDRLNAGRFLAFQLPDWTKDQHVAAAKYYLKEKLRLKDAWNREANRAAKESFGRPFEFTDYRISGIGSDAFSEKRKNNLRKFAYGSSDASSAEFAHTAAAKYAARRRA